MLVSGQDKIAMEDYNRAVDFMWENVSKKVFNLNVKANWFPDSSGVWYINQAKDNKRYIKIKLPGIEQSELFNHESLATLLTDSIGEEVKPGDLPISKLVYKNTNELLINVKRKTYIFNTELNTIGKYIPEEETEKNEIISPDKKWIAFTKDYNLYIRSSATDEIRQLSFSGKKGYEYANWYAWSDIMEGEDEERPLNLQLSWSEDSKWIYTNIYDLRNAEKMYLLNWGVDSLYRPKLLSYYRGSPGDTTMIHEEPVFFNIETGKEVKPGLRGTHINGVSMKWSVNPEKVYLEKSSRGFQNLYIYQFDLISGKLDTLYNESSLTNIDNFSFSLAEKRDRLFFLSEKSGWRQLYSLNLMSRPEIS